MKDRLGIAFVSSEMRPFAATGGLGDVAGALPKALSALGHDVRVIMPGYAMIEEQGYSLAHVPGLDNSIHVPNLGQFQVRMATLPGSAVQVYFLQDVDQDYFRRTHDRAQLYGWPDDDRRFTMLCRGTMELFYALGWKPDIIHCNDWQAGLIPAYLDSIYKYDFIHSATVYTTHNMLYSGPGGLSSITLWNSGLGRHLIPVVHPHEYYGQFNFAKGALTLADVVNTVSPTYAIEILQPESPPLPYRVRLGSGPLEAPEHTVTIPNGGPFHAILRHRRKHLPFLGIVNGIDVDYWDPETDAWLKLEALQKLAEDLHGPDSVQSLPLEEIGFGANDSQERFVQRKALQKERLQKLCGLPVDPNTLLIGRVARVGDQKDFLLMVDEARALRDILSLGCQMVVLGRASAQDAPGQWYKHVYENLDAEFPNQLCFVNHRWARWLQEPLPVQADFEFEHLIYAGSDAFLLPSIYEPCGLSQMISFRYGTVPIVRRTGGLADTVRDIQEAPHPEKGGGFIFDETSPNELVHAVRRAAQVYAADRSAWVGLQREGMGKDFSWNTSAAGYVEAYHLAMEVRRNRNNLD